ncbi:MAG: HDIG domain-containing protein [Desulfovibrionaceae bacterium]
MIRTKNTQTRPISLASTTLLIKSTHHCGRGLLVLVLTLLCLSILAGLNLERRMKVYVAGEVAEHDIIADRDMLVEDSQATKARQAQVMLLQPPVYDLSLEPYTLLHKRVVELFHEINGDSPEKPVPTIVQQLIDDLSPDVAAEVMRSLASPEVQTYVLNNLLPFVLGKVQDGIVGDMRSSRLGRSGVIIHNLDTNEEVLRSDITFFPDLQSVSAEISAHIRKEKLFSPATRRAMNLLVSTMISPSLTFNREASQGRGYEIAQNVDPVFYHLQRGELVVRKGERVGREQQIKLQAIYNHIGKRIQGHTLIGVFGIMLMLSLGLFIAPSGKPGTPLRCKDFVLISLVLLLFAVGAKGTYILGLRTGDLSLINSLAYGYPVAGAVGLVAMVFAARRYCTMGLLLAFACALMFKADMALFFYYFLGGMLTTWLVTKAQNRQDVVWSIIPMTMGQLILAFAAGMLAQTPLAELPYLACAAIGNSVVSLLLLFAFSPVLELTFGYTTRFRLMELMSLEQALMQDIMVTMPGTYHHSLVVANMVEAGAKAIGANSLLCKVAALYHDAGKLSHPEYFIENQFNCKNKHDKLSPSMSALILTSHVKKGTELAESHNLGQEIQDIIRQHHGTRVIRYFYQKALALGENPRESDYCYPGPRPQTKEAAIVMLADAVEASSRTLTDPTPARIQSHIDTIIKGIFSEGQLDESELTFKDLHRLSENFLRILTGIFHQRIAYPDGKAKVAEQEYKPKPPAEGSPSSAEMPPVSDKKDDPVVLQAIDRR